MLSVEDEHQDGSFSPFPHAGGGSSGGGSSTDLSAVSPRRAAARALAAASSADGSGGGAGNKQPTLSNSNNAFALAAAAMAAPFRKGSGSADRASSPEPHPPPLQRGESGLAFLRNDPSVEPFELEPGPERATEAAVATTTPQASSSSPSSSSAAVRAYEASVMRRVDRALLPCFMVLTLVNFLDRTNLSYASVQMSADIGLSPQQYGIGSSLFFLGYVGAQLPLVALAMRVGRVPFLAGSCVVWGCCAAAFAGVKGVTSFYVLRILLGVSEAATVSRFFFFSAHLFELAVRHP